MKGYIRRAIQSLPLSNTSFKHWQHCARNPLRNRTWCFGNFLLKLSIYSYIPGLTGFDNCKNIDRPSVWLILRLSFFNWLYQHFSISQGLSNCQYSLKQVLSEFVSATIAAIPPSGMVYLLSKFWIFLLSAAMSDSNENGVGFLKTFLMRSILRCFWYFLIAVTLGVVKVV